MEQYIAILLLVTPGFILIKVSELFNRQKEKKDAFEITVSSLISSVFVIIIVYFFLLLFTDLSLGDSDIKSQFSTPRFVIKYTIIALIVSISSGYFWNLLHPVCFSIINLLRRMAGKNEVFSGTSFESIFDDGKSHLVKAVKSGSEQVGLIESFNIIDDKLVELSVESQQSASKYIEKNHCKVKRTLVCGDYVITEYDCKELTQDNRKKSGWKFIINIGLLVFVLITIWIWCSCI